MPRADEGLAFLLRYENVAWYEDGKVRILDRRCYPHPIKFVTCNTSEEVANAMRDMIVQSAGPYLACGMGMVLAAYEAKDMPYDKAMEHIRYAQDLMVNARPTTAKRIKIITDSCVAAAEEAYAAGEKDAIQATFDRIIALTDNRYNKIGEVAKHLVSKFPDEGTVMTQCYAETILGFMCKEIKAQGKKIKFVCPETRPYFQGARLTASVLHDMGFDGKSCINPRQIDIVHEIFTPVKKDIIFAEKVIREIDTKKAQGIGVFTVDGKMIDIAFYDGAKRTIMMAKAAGVYEGDL